MSIHAQPVRHPPSPRGFAATTLVTLGLLGCGGPIGSAPPTECPSTATSTATPAPSPSTQEPTSATGEPGAEAPAATAERIELSFTKPLAGIATVEQALAKVKGALAAEGFGIITEIDVQTVMKKGLGVEMRPYWILGACNPGKAHQAIEGDPQMGLLLPCKVVVYQQTDGGFVVAFARPKAIFSLIGRPELSSLADEVETSMRKAFDAL